METRVCVAMVTASHLFKETFTYWIFFYIAPFIFIIALKQSVRTCSIFE